MALFASAQPTQIASDPLELLRHFAVLCLSATHADCVGKNAQKDDAIFDVLYCEQVDSFSETCADYFPCLFCCQSALWRHLRQPRSGNRPVERCEALRDSVLAGCSHNTHAGNCFGCAAKRLDCLVVEDYELFVVTLQRGLIKAVLGLVHVLKQESGIEVSLDSSAVWHVVPPLAERLFLICQILMIVLAGSHRG